MRIFRNFRNLTLTIVTTILAAPLFSQGVYPAVWPAGPARVSMPQWAAPGRIRFARWDGGRLEVAKAILTSWPGFNPPDPNRLESMINWYRPETVRFAREASINTIWVTFSNGFSLETEAPQQNELRRYIDECHRQGIHVIAYESISNMFWEDLYEHVPESRNWVYNGPLWDELRQIRLYASKLGRITRYVADLRKPEWHAYMRRRIDLALDAGADGVMLDNNFNPEPPAKVDDKNYLLDTYVEMYQYGSSRKRDFLLMGNFHPKTYVYNRVLNSFTTEDGEEPGIYAGRESVGTYPLEGGLLVNNIGVFRIQQALSEGWKPPMVEDVRRRLDGIREYAPLSAERHKLALAESMMFGVAMEVALEEGLQHGLITGDPETRRIWDAIGQYNRFFADNETYYTGAKSLARLAIVLDDRSSDVRLLNGLAARNVIYDVLYEYDLTAAKLAPYSAVALLDTKTVREAALAA